MRLCRLFVGADPDLWEATTRSLRLDGYVTSVRLEKFFWSVLADIGERDGLSLSQLIARLYSESLEEGHDIDNFASFLRVCCGRYLGLQLTGDIPVDIDTPIRGLDAEGILAREKARRDGTLRPLDATAPRSPQQSAAQGVTP